jgi:spore coat protein CotH
MTPRSFLVGSVLSAALLIADVAAVRAQSADDLFDVQTLQEIRLTISSRDLDRLRERYTEDTYYAADLTWNDVRVRNAGVRSRGGASRNPTKLGLRIDFDRYAAGRRFLGLGSIVLDNVWQDPGVIRERAAMVFFQRMGQPAPRESFCRLYINDVYQGVYAIVESVGPAFLSRTLDEKDGYLFQYQLWTPFHGEYLGDDLEPYKTLFEAETHRLDADTILYSPIRDLFREVNGPDDAVWRDRVERHIDLKQFVTYVAIETFLSEEDGILGPSGMNNFFLYRSKQDAPHRILPWDKDKVFESIGSPIFQRADENELFRRAMAFDDLRTLFLDVLEASARSAADEEWLEQEIVRSAAVVAEATYQDERKPFSNEEFDAAITFFIEFARKRPANVLEQVAQARQPQSQWQQLRRHR